MVTPSIYNLIFSFPSPPFFCCSYMHVSVLRRRVDESWRVVDMFKWMRLFWGPTRPPLLYTHFGRSVFSLMDNRYNKSSSGCCFMFSPALGSSEKHFFFFFPFARLSLVPLSRLRYRWRCGFCFSCSPLDFPFFLFPFIFKFPFSVIRAHLSDVWIDTRQQCRPTTLAILFNHSRPLFHS